MVPCSRGVCPYLRNATTPSEATRALSEANVFSALEGDASTRTHDIDTFETELMAFNIVERSTGESEGGIKVAMCVRLVIAALGSGFMAMQFSAELDELDARKLTRSHALA